MKTKTTICRGKCWVGVFCGDVYNRQLVEKKSLKKYKEVTETVLSYLNNRL